MHNKPSTGAGFSPAFEIGLKVLSHLGEAEVVMMIGILQIPLAQDY